MLTLNCFTENNRNSNMLMQQQLLNLAQQTAVFITTKILKFLRK